MHVYQAALLTAIVCGTFMETTKLHTVAAAKDAFKTSPPVKLPEQLIVGYANWNECNILHRYGYMIHTEKLMLLCNCLLYR